MCVDVSHLVLVALCDTSDHVVDESADGTDGGNFLAYAMVFADEDGTLGVLFKAYGLVTEVLDKCAYTNSVGLLFDRFRTTQGIALQSYLVVP